MGHMLGSSGSEGEGMTTRSFKQVAWKISRCSAKVMKYHLFLQSHMKTCSQPLHEDTFGGHLKVGLAQIAAMEISRGNHRDNKAVIRYLPWLYHPPSAMQQG